MEEVVARPALDVLVRDDVEAPAGRIADEEIDVSSEFHHDLYTITMTITTPHPEKYTCVHTLTRCYDDGMLDEYGSIIVVLPFKDEMVVAEGGGSYSMPAKVLVCVGGAT